MAKREHQKLKLLYLSKFLFQETDEEHPLTVSQLIERLQQHNIQAERKSIYSDLESLREFGFDVQCRKGRVPGWFIGQRDFELPELKLLVDAVQSSRFITRRKSSALIRKLEGLTNVHQARQLRRQVYVNGQIKVMNESIYYNVDTLHNALSTRRMITFRYFDYDMYRNRVFRREGKRYSVSPYGLIWNNENYYLVAFDSQSATMRHYRVDKLSDIAVTCIPRQGEEEYPNFDLAQYEQRHFGMFRGEDTSITLRCKSHMAGIVLDRFGQDIILVPDGAYYFTVTLSVVISPQFFGWLFGLEEEVALISPPSAVRAYQERLGAISNLYLTIENGPAS